jgi:predicted amidohydrolase
MTILRKMVTSFTLLLSLLACVSLHGFSDSTPTIIAIQLSTTDAGNFEKMRELVKKAKSFGADLVIFPEESVFGWLNPDVFLEATPIPGKYNDIFATLAKDEHI